MKPTLVDPAQAPAVPGLHVPFQFYWVLESPSPLAGMEFPDPRGRFWDHLHQAGFRWVVCLASEQPRYDPKPLRPLVTVDLEDLHGERWPADPENQEHAILAIGTRVCEKLRQGEGVVVHCAGGTGRTGTVLGVALKMLRLKDGEVLDFLNRVHRRRKKDGWPESGWQEDVVRRAGPRNGEAGPPNA